MKRLKNIEGKNEEQLGTIKDQVEGQLDVIDNKGKKQSKTINKQEEQLKKLGVKKQLIK